jgi:hypothetical protein
MFELPEIKKKKPKPPYKKPEAVKELERLANAEARCKHPAVDPKYIAPRLFRDDTANSLTDCVVKYITLKAGFASRINSTGVYDKNLRKYRRGTQKRGIADIMATFRGLSLHIEVKHGRDVQSESQKKIESDVKTSGGRYFIARNFTDFKTWFDQL